MTAKENIQNKIDLYRKRLDSLNNDIYKLNDLLSKRRTEFIQTEGAIRGLEMAIADLEVEELKEKETKEPK